MRSLGSSGEARVRLANSSFAVAGDGYRSAIEEPGYIDSPRPGGETVAACFSLTMCLCDATPPAYLVFADHISHVLLQVCVLVQ